MSQLTLVLQQQFKIIYFFFLLGVTFLCFSECISECVFIKYYEFKLFTMKNIFASNNKKSDSKTFGLELLSEKEMLSVRGGYDKPISRPKDSYDYEEE